MADITNASSFEAWLENKPPEWARVLALRSALRSLPNVTKEKSEISQLASFRCAFLGWAATTFEISDLKNRSISTSSFTVDKNRDRSAVVSAAIDAFFIFSYDEPTKVASRTGTFSAAAIGEIAWNEISADCSVLEKGGTLDSLESRPLWNREIPASIQAWRKDLNVLPGLREGAFWLDWYDIRLAGGNDSAFNLPPSSDEAVARRLSETGDAFWDRSPVEINAEIAGWIEQAWADAKQLEPEAQNPIAPVFNADADGIIGVDILSGSDEIQKDAEASDRYDEALGATDRAISACSGNAATYTRGSLARYLEALGESIDSMHPGQLIQRGEALRQELAERERDVNDSDLPPIPGLALLALREVITAHNLLVGLDPALARRDEARLGPDALQTQISPEQAREIIVSAAAAGLVTPEARDIIETATDLAPSEPNPENRRSRQLTETVRNFGRKVVSLLNAALRAPVRTTAIGVVSATAIGTGAALGVGAAVVAGGSAAVVCYKLGQWALKNEAWFLQAFAGNETMLRAVGHVMKELRKLPVS